MKPRISADRARRFCQALAAESEGRRTMPWWSSIHTVAQRIGLAYDEAVAQAVACAQAGYVTHDQSQHTKAARREALSPHSVCLTEEGRQLSASASSAASAPGSRARSSSRPRSRPVRRPRP